MAPILINKTFRKILVIILSMTMVFTVFSLGPVFASDVEGGGITIEDLIEGTYVPGQLIVGMKDGVRIPKAELTSQESLTNLFPGVGILSVKDIMDLSDILGDEYKPYEGRQLLRFILNDDSKENLIYAMQVLQENPLVKFAELNSIYKITDDLLANNEYRPGQLILGMRDDVRLSKEELENHEILISLFPGIRIQRVKDIMDLSDILGDEYRPYEGQQLLFLALASESVEYMREAMTKLSENVLVKFVEPNWIYRVCLAPNDIYYSAGLILGLNKIQASLAWDISTGSQSVTVGVMDTGIDHTHPDLAANVSDALGYNFLNGSTYAMDDHINSHGTHVAGIIGAVGNNSIGVVGVNWNVTLVPLKVAYADGTSDIYCQAMAIGYAQQKGIKILNCSIAGPVASAGLKAAIDIYSGLLVAAAGNSSENLDLYPYYPAGYPCPNIISVAATDNSDVKRSTSNYGATSVHLAAPGEWIYSTIRNNNYGYSSGTSMAAPHVAGVAALLLSYNPYLTTQQLKSAILDNVDIVPALSGLVSTGGRLNAYKALNSLGSYTPGDVNRDGVVDELDLLYLARALNQWTGYYLSPACDVNGDGVVDEFDWLYLARHLNGWVGYEILGPRGQ